MTLGLWRAGEASFKTIPRCKILTGKKLSCATAIQKLPCARTKAGERRAAMRSQQRADMGMHAPTLGTPELTTSCVPPGPAPTTPAHTWRRMSTTCGASRVMPKGVPSCTGWERANLFAFKVGGQGGREQAVCTCLATAMPHLAGGRSREPCRCNSSDCQEQTGE